MIIDLKTLKLHPGKREDFHLQAQGRKDWLGSDGSFLDPIEISLQVQNHGRFFNARGTLITKLALRCSRCLETLIWPISIDFSFTVALEEDRHLSREDEDFIPYGSGLVDIEPLIGELIVTEIPFTPICREECLGLCPVCGCNRNKQSCTCQKDEIDPRWDKLKKLK